MLIAHLSDTHFRTGPLGAGPAAGLNLALGRVLALEPRPDCVVVTGDLADTGDPREYADLHAVLDRCPVPVHLTTGNHDDPRALLAEFGGTRYLGGGAATRYVAEYPGATVVVADSHLPGEIAGRLGAEQLDWIDAALAARTGVPALVALHHPPVPVGLPFMDGIRLQDGPELAAVLARHDHVVRVLAGHLHRTVSAAFAGTVLTVAPSTYRQINPRMSDDAPPGYLDEPTSFLLHVLDGAACVTHSYAASHSSGPLAF